MPSSSAAPSPDNPMVVFFARGMHPSDSAELERVANWQQFEGLVGPGGYRGETSASTVTVLIEPRLPVDGESAEEVEQPKAPPLISGAGLPDDVVEQLAGITWYLYGNSTIASTYRAEVGSREIVLTVSNLFEPTCCDGRFPAREEPAESAAAEVTS